MKKNYFVHASSYVDEGGKTGLYRDKDWAFLYYERD